MSEKAVLSFYMIFTCMYLYLNFKMVANYGHLANSAR